MAFLQQFVEKIKQYETIVIHRHTNPDPDALGSQLGLAELIRVNFKKTVYCVGEDLESLSFIGKMNAISDDIYAQSLVIVTDTANTPRIDDQRYQLGKEVIKIDHHPVVDAYGQLQHVDTTASSTCEIIVDIALQLSWEVSVEAARLLYSGIVGDTGRFLYANTTQKTMEIVSYLRSFDFSATDIHYKMITNPIAVTRLIGYVLQQLTVSEHGVASVIISQKLLKEYGLTDEHTQAIVSQPGSVEGVVCWGIFVEQPSGKYRCRLRSKAPHINTVAQRHDGGGHPLASGANAQDLNEVYSIIEELNEVAQQG